jgi:hypothetical protein
VTTTTPQAARLCHVFQWAESIVPAALRAGAAVSRPHLFSSQAADVLQNPLPLSGRLPFHDFSPRDIEFNR